MTKTRFFPSLILLALLLASCAPAASPAPSVDPPSVQEPASPVVVEPSATPILSGATEGSAVEGPTLESAAPTPLPIATSRGPDLHATDPGTVNLGSGQLQFLEFFRFT